MNPVVLPRAEHPISRKLIDPEALKVMYRLLKAGHRAYLVGGGVRDLLLGRTPKDFDVGTDAHPHQIKRLFRNCRLVGRRFRLAHVHFGEKIIEVSTFRKRSEFEENESKDRLIRSDNTFGTAEDDAIRRDFTINGLFYDLETFGVLDYVGGIEDLHTRLVRSIGDPEERIPEDPVRIIRAIKFAARLDFKVDETLWAAMVAHAEDIHKCAKARVLEEIYRLLREGSAAASFQLLEESGLLRQLLPELDEHLKRAQERGGDAVFWQYLTALDRWNVEDGELSNSLFLGSLAVHLLGLASGSSMNEDPREPLAKRIDALTWEWVERLGVARRDRERLAHMLRAQPRFVRTRGRRFRPRSFVTKHYYRDAESLFALGCLATGQDLETLTRWKEIRGDLDAKGERAEEPPEPQAKPGSRRRRHRGRDRAREDALVPAPAPQAESPPSRRRRRRRRTRPRGSP